MRRSALQRIAAHFRNTCLVASFGIGFFILFAFLPVTARARGAAALRPA